MVREREIQTAIIEHNDLADKKFEKAAKEFWRKGASMEFRELKREVDLHKFAVQVLEDIMKTR